MADAPEGTTDQDIAATTEMDAVDPVRAAPVTAAAAAEVVDPRGTAGDRGPVRTIGVPDELARSAERGEARPGRAEGAYQVTQVPSVAPGPFVGKAPRAIAAGEETSAPRHFASSRPRGDGPLPWRQRPAFVPIAAVAAVVGLLTLAWAVDTVALSGQVARNVEVAGRPVGGLSEAALGDVLAGIADDVAAREVQIHSGDLTYETTAAALGLEVDQEATADAVMDAGRGGFVVVRPFTWVASLFGTSDVTIRSEVDEGAMALELAQLQGDDATAAVEPTIVYDQNTHELTAAPGRSGTGLDARRVAAALVDAVAEASGGAIEITAEATDVSPQHTDEQAGELAAEANAMTAAGLTLTIGDATARVEAAQLRQWIGLVPPDQGFELAIDGTKVTDALPGLFAGLAGVRNATVTLGAGGRPEVVPAVQGVDCCAGDSAEGILKALEAGEPEVTLEAEVTEPEITTEEVEAWGITEPVGGNRAWQNGAEASGPAPGFTTYHAPGESRVTNIHRIADLVRGAVIPPGGSFSINDHVGERTVEKGFVEAGAIREGEHVPEVGGGISQFATTTFNAAYFAGLDITTYQAHSEYFSRYPRGREATMGYPAPNLVIENDTPYGVLIWTSYTDSSLTVTMYSTPYARAEQTGITESPSQQCTHVQTTRTRTYPDGTTDTDTFQATYRPGPGIGCDGKPINPPPEDGQPPEEGQPPDGGQRPEG